MFYKVKLKRDNISVIKNMNGNSLSIFNGRQQDPTEDALKWKHPFTCIVSGPSCSGKTSFVLRLIQDADVLFNKTPQTISWHYGEFQNWMLDPKYKDIHFVEGIPDSDSLDSTRNNLVIIDDLMHEAGEAVSKLFTKGSHHRNTSVIFLTQNIFHQSKQSRTINLNAHYIVLFKNIRDASQITNLAKQMYPGNINYLRCSYEDATRKPYGYLMIDLKPDTDDSLRLRTDIFPGEIHYVYHKI